MRIVIGVRKWAIASPFIVAGSVAIGWPLAKFAGRPDPVPSPKPCIEGAGNLKNITVVNCASPEERLTIEGDFVVCRCPHSTDGGAP